MECRILLALLTADLVLAGARPSEARNDDLVFTSVLYRHGDRSPIFTFPTNPVPNSAWPQGLKQLTVLGMRQQYYLGKFFYQRYTEEFNSAFLFNNYTRTQIYVRSTDVDRTLMSAQCQLAGLFKPNQSQEFIPDLSWQPVPVHTVRVEDDYLLRGSDANCPKYQQLKRQMSDLTEYKHLNNQYQYFFEFLEKQTGEEKIDLSNLFKLSDTAKVLLIHGHDLPWYNESVRSTMNMLEGDGLSFLFDPPPRSRLACGSLVQNILDEMNMKVNGSLPEKKIQFYSAHDTTVACLLTAFASFDRIRPDYCSSVVVEFYNAAGSYYVKVWYKYGPLSNTTSGQLLCNESSPQPFASTEECLRPITIPGCSAFKCPFNEFANALASVKISPENLQKECQLSSSPNSADQLRTWTGVGIAFIVISVILTVVLTILAIVLGVHHVHKKAKGEEVLLSNSEDLYDYSRYGVKK